MNGVAGLLAVILGDEGGEGGGGEGVGGPQVNVNVSWQVVAVLVAAVVVLLLLAGIVVLILGRRPGRLPIWRQKRLEIEETMLNEGPRRALIRLRLQLDDAISIAKSTAATEAGDIGDLRLLVHQLESAAGRVAAQIDALLHGGSDNIPRHVVDAVRARVRELEAAGGSLADAATAAVTGATAVQIQELSTGVRDQLKLVEDRTDALRELSDSNTPDSTISTQDGGTS